MPLGHAAVESAVTTSRIPSRPVRILITGASGCIGQHVAAWLLNNSDAELVLWLRQPQRLTAINHRHPRVSLLVGDLCQPERFSQQLASIDRVVHTATAWGDPERAVRVNVEAVKQLLALLNPQRLQQVVYFSTASILDRNLELLAEAQQWGTEYIRTKSICLQQLMAHPLRDRIVAVFPTLVFSGTVDGRCSYPISYLTAGLVSAVKWLPVARFLRAEGSYHFIHAADVASVCGHLLSTPHNAGPAHWGFIPRYVIGQEAQTINGTIATLRRYRGLARTPGFPLWNGLVRVLMWLLRIDITPWDRFSLQRRHFVHAPVTRPESFGLCSHCPTWEHVLQAARLPSRGPLPRLPTAGASAAT